MVLVHLDTDLGGDTDDACALAMLLGWSDVEIGGITTTIDPGGRRAGCVVALLQLAGRAGIAVAAGSEASLTTLKSDWGVTDEDERYWPQPVPARPSSPGAALDLLARNVERGATVVAIGPYTNLALLETVRPGILRDVPVVVMGGWFGPADEGLPAWGPEMDFNVQCDTRAVEILVGSGAALTLAPLLVTMNAQLRAADLPRLRRSGPLGELLADQSEVYGPTRNRRDLGRAHAGLPDDLLNFQYDPVTCAIAVGWSNCTIEQMRVRTVVEDSLLRFAPDDDGALVRVVTELDGREFDDAWLGAIERAAQI